MNGIKFLVKKVLPKSIIDIYRKNNFKEQIVNELNRDHNVKYKKNNIKLIPSKKSYYEQTANLFHKIDIKYSNRFYFYYLDYFHRLYNENIMIDNMPIDYSMTMNSLEELKDYSKELYGSNIIFDSIANYIDKVVSNYSIVSDRDKIVVKYIKNIKNKKVKHFDEALQRILFYNQLLWQTNHKLVGLGRLDKILINYYQNDINNKVLSKDDAFDMIKEFIKILHADYVFKSSALLGDTGQLIILGGYDENNNYVCNDLTFMFIDAIRKLQLPDPKILLRVSKDTPRELMEISLKCLLTGIGCPLFANDGVIIPSLISAGFDFKDVNDYVTSACWEPIILGKSFDQNNLMDIIFLEPLNRAMKKNDLKSIKSYNELLNKYEIELRLYLKELINKLNNIKFQEDPLMSIFTRDCIKNNKDISSGGAKYNNYGLLSLGLNNTINSLLTLKELVFEKKEYTLEKFNDMRVNNKILKEEIVKKFGKDDNNVIILTNKIMDITSNELLKCKNPLGGNYKFGLSSPGYISASKNSEASFDGRKAGTPYSVHISSEDALAYTELIQFAGKLNYKQNKYNGNVVDFFVSPFLIDNNFSKFVDFLMLSLKTGFFEMQMNVVGSETLIAAKKNPENFPNLIVRVWGFSAYFKDLPDEYKDLMIERALKNEGRL